MNPADAARERAARIEALNRGAARLRGSSSPTVANGAPGAPPAAPTREQRIARLQSILSSGDGQAPWWHRECVGNEAHGVISALGLDLGADVGHCTAADLITRARVRVSDGAAERVARALETRFGALLTDRLAPPAPVPPASPASGDWTPPAIASRVARRRAGLPEDRPAAADLESPPEQPAARARGAAPILPYKSPRNAAEIAANARASRDHYADLAAARALLGADAPAAPEGDE